MDRVSHFPSLYPYLPYVPQKVESLRAMYTKKIKDLEARVKVRVVRV